MGESPKQMAVSSYALDDTIIKSDNLNFDGNGTTATTDSVRIHLAETFYISSKKNTVFRVRLTERGLTLRKETNDSAKEQTIQIEDIIGCRSLRSKRKRREGTSCTCPASPGPAQLKVVEDNSLDLDENDVSAYLYIYAYILKKNQRGVPRRRERTTITLRFRSFDRYEDNDREAQKWRTAIKNLTQYNDAAAMATKYGGDVLSTVNAASSLTYVPKDLRKVLIILNPKSGSGKSRESFQKYVAPVFVEAEVPYELQVTRYANYAREFVRHKDIYMWRSIVVVGGDGILFEILNGLFERPDWERAMNELPIGVIPCGSGNGLAKAISHSYK
jgi:sphingosine kinase